ncbi:MAG: helix-turn-helix domain-containing protein [Terriglobia bacterium]
MKPETNTTLAEIIADSSRIEVLAPEAIAGLRSELTRLDTLLLGRLMSANGGLSSGPHPDRRLSVAEAAEKLGVSKDYLYRHANRLPFTVRIGRSLGFSERGVETYLRQRPGR